MKLGTFFCIFELTIFCWSSTSIWVKNFFELDLPLVQNPKNWYPEYAIDFLTFQNELSAWNTTRLENGLTNQNSYFMYMNECESRRTKELYMILSGANSIVFSLVIDWFRVIVWLYLNVVDDFSIYVFGGGGCGEWVEEGQFVSNRK